MLVRINPTDSEWFSDDLAAVAGSAADGVVLPKFESAEWSGCCAPDCVRTP